LKPISSLIEKKPQVEDVQMTSENEVIEEPKEEDEIFRPLKQRRVRRLESEDEEIKDETTVKPVEKPDQDMSEQPEMTDISNRPPAPGKKWVQVKKTESGMLDDGTFFARDIMVWEQVDVDEKTVQKKAEPQKRVPANAAPKQTQKGLAAFFGKK
jgi:hypothetical protein